MGELILQLSYSLDTLPQQMQRFWNCAHSHRVLAFHGEMGAGKTTFIRNLCRLLGVKDAVSSPTFALINEYHFLENGKDKTIYHMDWYRLRDAEEAINAGIEDALNTTDAYCFVEWPEKADVLLPRPHLRVEIEWVSDTERNMKLIVEE
ncbi:MAG TPA: tRNA (adenosine(37)-N6)-threonylcarbamoyltransferase complex ATPase subunit type 1 TsaE [Flavipsychrobacter sp.]|nr:tRNA (adenosine(37)-N6)-threonylcarbamoyltransferase complex ATPase subunit type 1 TsaE [Flavipsychrobacter sp.]